jgi:hypothetical protein
VLVKKRCVSHHRESVSHPSSTANRVGASEYEFKV